MKKHLLGNSLLSLLITTTFYSDTLAQSDSKKTQINFFGHLEYDFDKMPSGNNSFFSLGEQDFF
ncbi:MAG: hypothetical protein ACK46S_11760, partial [Bacteroidota bacterium]